jgi:hypothetical protein
LDDEVGKNVPISDHNPITQHAENENTCGAKTAIFEANLQKKQPNIANSNTLQRRRNRKHPAH